MTQVTITITENPLNVAYSIEDVLMNAAGDITYQINSQSTGWTILGVGNANENSYANLSYASQALPMKEQDTSGDPIGVMLPVSSAQSVVIHDHFTTAEATGELCVCRFSFLLTNGSVTLLHDPQVTNDPG